MFPLQSIFPLGILARQEVTRVQSLFGTFDNGDVVEQVAGVEARRKGGPDIGEVASGMSAPNNGSCQ